jgi:hypothetical protein
LRWAIETLNSWPIEEQRATIAATHRQGDQLQTKEFVSTRIEGIATVPIGGASGAFTPERGLQDADKDHHFRGPGGVARIYRPRALRPGTIERHQR